MKPQVDPIAFAKKFWPHVYFYSKQREAIYSFLENNETVIPAGNKLGKDFVAGFLCVYFFLTRNPVRVVTTSAKDDHLRVLWGEINNFIATANVALDVRKGGPLLVNHQDIRKIVGGEKDPKSYMIGLVAGPDSMAAMQGHHIAQTGDGIPRTAFFCDESSSVDNEYWKMASTWANRAFIFGNPWPCQNFFADKVEGGDVKKPRGQGLITKVIEIGAYDSPNVRYALAEIEKGLPVSDKVLVPGVKTYEELEQNLQAWDALQISVSVHGKFYKGAEIMFFPQEWLDAAAARARQLHGVKRVATAIGCDPGEGGDNTAWCVGDELGIIDMVSEKTPNTAKIKHMTIALAARHGVPPESWLFDAGGGGRQITDQLREMGYNVPEAVAFGAAPSLDIKRWKTFFGEKRDVKEEKGGYENMRAELFGVMSDAVDPNNKDPWAIPAKYKELCRQLAKMPKLYGPEGKLMMLPKNRKPDSKTKNKTLVELLGRSPDEADAAALCCWRVFKPNRAPIAGAI